MVRVGLLNGLSILHGRHACHCIQNTSCDMHLHPLLVSFSMDFVQLHALNVDSDLDVHCMQDSKFKGNFVLIILFLSYNNYLIGYYNTR